MDVTLIFNALVIIAGMIVCAGGLVWILTPAVPWLGRLPSDIKVKTKDFDFYLPLTSSLVVCIVLAVLGRTLFSWQMTW